MNTFNRVFTIVLALVILAGAVIVLLVTFGAVLPDFLPYGWWSGQLEGLTQIRGGDLALAIGVSIVLAVGMIALLIFEALPRRGGRPLLISSGEEGAVTIHPESICLLANNIGLTIRNVNRIDNSIRKSPEGLVINSKPVVALGANVPQVSAELQSRIKEAIEESTSLAVSRVIVNAHYEPVKGKSLAVK
jgi:hypothetical protein